jgi:hypothetical protein
MILWQIVADASALLVQIGANRRTARLILFRPHLRKSLTVLMRHRTTVGTLALSQIINSANHPDTLWGAPRRMVFSCQPVRLRAQ